MTTVTSEQVRDQLGEIINRVAFGRERMIVTRHGKRIAALIPIEDMDLLEKMLETLEDQLDMPLINERLAEAENGDTVSWETIKAEHKL